MGVVKCVAVDLPQRKSAFVRVRKLTVGRLVALMLRLCRRVASRRPVRNVVPRANMASWQRFAGALRPCGVQPSPSVRNRPMRAWRSRVTPTRHWKVSQRSYATEYPPHIPVAFPALSPTMDKGNLIAWKKAVGDPVEPGDFLAEIETDKTTSGWEVQDEGYVAALLIPDGASDVEVGQVVAVIVSSPDEVAAFKDYEAPPMDASGANEPPPAPAPPAPTPPPSSSSSSPSSAPVSDKYPSHTPVAFPALSPSMETGTVVAWKKAEGDAVEPGDVLAEVETDKAVADWDVQDEGFVAKLLVPDGTADVPVGQIVAVIVGSKSEVAAFKDYTGEAPAPESTPASEPTPAPAAAASASTASAPAAASSAPRKPGDRVIASPAARALAAKQGVVLGDVSGSGPGGRIVLTDVKSAPTGAAATAAKEAAPAQAPAPAPAASAGTFTDLPLSQVRRVTAQRLTQSKQTVPHYYLTIDVAMDAVVQLRAELNAAGDGQYKLSVNDFVVKASALACKHVPEANSHWHNDFIRRYEDVNINVAVDTPTGLFVPVIQSAHTKGLAAINASVRELATKAKDGNLSLAEMEGGTFTISNLGMMGVTQFAAVINPPQSCILAVGASQKRLVPGEGEFDAPRTVTTMSVTLSADHRVIDGAVGARWLAKFRDFMENPYKMLL